MEGRAEAFTLPGDTQTQLNDIFVTSHSERGARRGDTLAPRRYFTRHRHHHQRANVYWVEERLVLRCLTFHPPLQTLGVLSSPILRVRLITPTGHSYPYSRIIFLIARGVSSHCVNKASLVWPFFFFFTCFPVLDLLSDANI